MSLSRRINKDFAFDNVLVCTELRQGANLSIKTDTVISFGPSLAIFSHHYKVLVHLFVQSLNGFY